MHGWMDVFTISRRDRKRVRKVRKGRERERETERPRQGGMETLSVPGTLVLSPNPITS